MQACQRGRQKAKPAPVALEPLPGPTHNRPQQVLMAVWGCWAKGCWGAEYPLRFFSADTPHPTPTGPGKTLHFVTPPCTKATFLLSLGEFLASPQLPLSPLSSSCLRGPDRTPPQTCRGPSNPLSPEAPSCPPQWVLCGKSILKSVNVPCRREQS